MITGYDLINNYYEDEKLYSTGDSELDDLLERAFCEGYEYAQREYTAVVERTMAKEALRKIGKRKVPKLELISPEKKEKIKKLLDESEKTIREYYKNNGFIW